MPKITLFNDKLNQPSKSFKSIEIIDEDEVK